MLVVGTVVRTYVVAGSSITSVCGSVNGKGGSADTSKW